VPIPINPPAWDRDKANTLLLLQAARFQALANLLELKGIVSRGEIATATAAVIEDEMPRLIGNMTLAAED
jgi:hypothetical protein